MEARTERIDIMSDPIGFDARLKKECDLKGTKGYRLSAASTVMDASTNKLEALLTFQGENPSSINTETKTKGISLQEPPNEVDTLIRGESDLFSGVDYLLRASFIMSDNLILVYQK